MRLVHERLNRRRGWRGAYCGPMCDAAAADVHAAATWNGRIAASGLGGRRPLFSPRVSRPLHRGLVCRQPATAAAARMPLLQGCFQQSTNLNVSIQRRTMQRSRTLLDLDYARLTLEVDLAKAGATDLIARLKALEF